MRIAILALCGAVLVSQAEAQVRADSRNLAASSRATFVKVEASPEDGCPVDKSKVFEIVQNVLGEAVKITDQTMSEISVDIKTLSVSGDCVVSIYSSWVTNAFAVTFDAIHGNLRIVLGSQHTVEREKLRSFVTPYEQFLSRALVRNIGTMVANARGEPLPVFLP